MILFLIYALSGIKAVSKRFRFAVFYEPVYAESYEFYNTLKKYIFEYYK